jgi:hypothetical protein
MILIETDILKNTDDIYALTRAFFPGEKITITCRQGTPDDMSHPVTKRENSGKGGKLVYKSDIGAMFDVEVCDLSKDEFDERLFDRDNGDGTAAKAIENLRKGLISDDANDDLLESLRCIASMEKEGDE